MWKFIAVCFGFLSFSITNLQAISVVNGVGILNAPILNRTSFSQISINDEINAITTTSFSTKMQSASPPIVNSFSDRRMITNETRRIAKRSIFGESVNIQVELGPFGYSKLILFAILRIVFGIALDVSKMKEVLKRPRGLLISYLCHILFLPLVRGKIQ